MMKTTDSHPVRMVELDVAQASLSELIAGLGQDEELIIVRNSTPLARILPSKKSKPLFGNCKGLLTIVDDDDEHLKDFEIQMS